MKTCQQHYTQRQVAAMLSVDRSTVYRLIKRGLLVGYSIGGRCRIPLGSIERYLESVRIAPNAPEGS